MIVQIRPDQIADWAQQQGHAVPLVLDVREAWELQTASVKPDGFDLLAIPLGDLPRRLADIDTERPIACLCHHGARSQRAASFLMQQGYSKLANVAGGIDAWSQVRDPAVPRY